MAPAVILRMDVHCRGCAGKIRRAINNLLGVEEVWVSADTGLVVVKGTSPPLDPSQLRWRIQTRTRRPVTVVSDGGSEDHCYPPPQPQQYAAPPSGYQHHHYSGGMIHVGPPPPAPAYPSYPYGGGGVGWVPAPAPPHLLQYVPTSSADGGYHFPSRQYVPNDAPVWFNDDNPNGCCSVQ